MLLASGLGESIDTFTLSDVAVAAQSILNICVKSGEKQAPTGGLVTVGNEKGFFVAVNGKIPSKKAFNVNGLKNGAPGLKGVSTS